MSHISGGRPKTFEQIALMANALRAIDLAVVLQRSGCLTDASQKAKWHTPVGTISITAQKHPCDTGVYQVICHMQKRPTTYERVLRSLLLQILRLFAYDSCLAVPVPR